MLTTEVQEDSFIHFLRVHFTKYEWVRNLTSIQTGIIRSLHCIEKGSVRGEEREERRTQRMEFAQMIGLQSLPEDKLNTTDFSHNCLCVCYWLTLRNSIQ